MADDSTYYHRHMKDLLHRTTPHLGLLVLLAAALGCLVLLFELFVGLTFAGGNDLSVGPSLEVPSGASLMTVLAAVTCIALGAAALLLLRRWLKDRPGTPRWVMVCGGAPAVAIVALGIYLLVSGTTHGSLPYGSIPYVNYQVNAGGMDPLGVTVVAIVVLAVVLVGVMKPRLLILLLALFLVSILMFGLLSSSALQGQNLLGRPSQMFGLLSSSALQGQNLFGRPSQLQPTAGYAEEVNALRQRGPVIVPSSQELDTGAVERPVGDPGSGDSRTGEAARTGGPSPRTPSAASADDHPPQPTPAVRDSATEATESVFMEVKGERTTPVGVPYRLTGALTGADGEPLPSMPVTINVDGQPEAILHTDAQGGFAWETVFNEATEATVDIGFPGNTELGPSQTRWPVTAATPEIAVEPPEPVARGDALMLRGTVSVGGRPVPDTPVTVDGEQLGRTDANGAFALPFQVPAGTALGTLPLELAAPALKAAAIVLAPVMSATSLLVTPLGRLIHGLPLPVEARLLDDQGIGIPNATIHDGQGGTGITGPDGVAKFVLPALEGVDLSEILTTFKFDGDESNLPVDHAVEAPVSSDGGFNWLLWVGLPLAVVIGSVAAYLLARRFRSLAGLLRRACGLVPFLWGSLATRRRRNSRSGEEEERVPALLDLSFPKLPADGEKVWQVGEQVSLQCVLIGGSGEPMDRVTVELDWGDSKDPSQLTTDRKGRCVATWSAYEEGTYRVTASFAGDDHYLPATAVEDFRVRGQVATHLDIALVKPAEDLPYIWGIGEPVHVEIMLRDDSGEGVGGRTVTAMIGEPGQPVGLLTDAGGRCRISWTGAVPGTYRVVVDFAGEDQCLPTSAHHEFEVVDFRDDVVRRYNSFLPWVREREPRVSEQTTPREMEVMVVDSGMPIDHRAMEVVIARFEEADYSLHEIDRPRFEAMYRARRKIVGD